MLISGAGAFAWYVLIALAVRYLIHRAQEVMIQMLAGSARTEGIWKTALENRKGDHLCSIENGFFDHFVFCR